MVAEDGSDVRIRLLTCGFAFVVVTVSVRYALPTRPGGTGRRRLPAAIRAQYVPKF